MCVTLDVVDDDQNEPKEGLTVSVVGLGSQVAISPPSAVPVLICDEDCKKR